MLRSLAVALVAGGAVLAAEPAADAALAACHACTAAVTETIARAPILAREGAKAEDKESAVFDALSCDAYNFRPYTDDPSSMSKACARVLEAHNAEGELVAALVAGADAKAACAAPCAGVDEDKRMPVYSPPPAKAAKPGKGKEEGGKKKGSASSKGAAAGRKGTVDDPQVKEALKKKAERDARRAAKRGGRKEDEEL